MSRMWLQVGKRGRLPLLPPLWVRGLRIKEGRTMRYSFLWGEKLTTCVNCPIVWIDARRPERGFCQITGEPIMQWDSMPDTCPLVEIKEGECR